MELDEPEAEAEFDPELELLPELVELLLELLKSAERLCCRLAYACCASDRLPD